MKTHVLLLCLCALVVPVRAASPAELHGIWMHATQVKTPADADAVVRKVERANLNAVFMLVWYWGGQAFFRSDLCPMGDGVPAGYDPLGYMVQQCHKRGVQVHAWFVNGAYGAGEPRHVLDKHPDWAVDDGAGGTLWYDFGKPQVRRFQSDLMIECLSRYDIDGLHFDYIRYGPHECYCQHCQTEFSRRYGFEPLSEQRRKSFPAAVSLSGNPLAKPSTAVVLATLSDGTPAIALNKLDKGVSLLLNWHAEDEMPPAVAETVKLVFGMWAVEGAGVHIMTTDTTRGEYGTRSLDAARACLTRLGYRPASVSPERLRTLPSAATLVLPAVYNIPEQTARDLEEFMRRGGRLFIIDGPVKSMHLTAVQRITGFTATGRYINRADIIEPVGRHPLMLHDGYRIDPARWKRRTELWAEYRKAGVTELVRDVSRRARDLKPGVQVSAAVFSSLESADSVFQDWPLWLREKTVDFVVPMAYTEDTGELGRQIAQWRSVDHQLQRIVPGLSIYQKAAGQTTTRDLGLIRRQYRLCCQQGARGNMYFALPYLSDPLIELFRTEFYPVEASRQDTRGLRKTE